MPGTIAKEICNSGVEFWLLPLFHYVSFNEISKVGQNSEEVLKDFIKAIGLFADMYYEANIDQMKATGADVHYKFQMPEASVERVGKLLKGEGWLYNSSGVTREESYGSTWQYMITRSINRVDGATSIDEYLERRDNPDSKTVSPVDQSRTLLGYMYRKAGSEDVKTGTEIWTNDLMKSNEVNGAKLEVALVTLGNPASDDFQYRDDIRIWTQSDLRTILHARAHKYIAQFLWTPPWNWNRNVEISWRNTYIAHHNGLSPDK